ncbi:hypothetical protein [Psychrobacter sp. DM4]|uniref:hypothetical protein n=1 Tax=Psychrobacter sp. DM4 TaxID=3440637 RepID=UPI003F508AE2
MSRPHHLGPSVSRHAKKCLDTPQDISKHWYNLSAYLDSMNSHFDIGQHLIVTVLEPYRESHSKVAAALIALDEPHKRLRIFLFEPTSAG